MLRNVKDLRGYTILATDGAIGEVDDLYFDDDRLGDPVSRRRHGQLAFRQEGADLPARHRAAGLDGPAAPGIPHEGAG